MTWIIKRKSSILLLLLASCLLTSCTGRPDTVVVVAGSTSVQPYAEILAEEFGALYPDMDIDVQGGGSSSGITAAEVGIADIGMSSRPLRESEKDLWNVLIAKDGLAIVVHPSNPVKNLTLEQIRGIYAGEITNWSQVGGWGARIHLSAREEGSGTRGAFDELVMGGLRVTSKSIIQDSNGAIRQFVSGDPNAVGFLSLGLVNDTVTALQIDGVTANRENVQNSSYSLYRPFLFVAKNQPEGSAWQFIEFILSDKGKEILIEEGLIPD